MGSTVSGALSMTPLSPISTQLLVPYTSVMEVLHGGATVIVEVVRTWHSMLIPICSAPRTDAQSTPTNPSLFHISRIDLRPISGCNRRVEKLALTFAQILDTAVRWLSLMMAWSLVHHSGVVVEVTLEDPVSSSLVSTSGRSYKGL